jgi:hypothetical protein
MSDQVVFQYANEASAVYDAAQEAVDLINQLVEESGLCDETEPDGNKTTATHASWLYDSLAVDEVIVPKLDAAREKIQQAWSNLADVVKRDEPREESNATLGAYRKTVENNRPGTLYNEEHYGTPGLKSQDSGANEKDELLMKTAYLNIVTDAFATELEELHADCERRGKKVDVNVLIDCLQSDCEYLMTTADERNYLRSEFAKQQGNTSNDPIAQIEDENDGLTPHEARRRELGFHKMPSLD